LARLDNQAWWHQLSSLYRDYCKRRGRPDVLHVHSLQPAGYLCAELPATVRVLTEHSSAFHATNAAELAREYAPASSRYDARVAVSASFARKLSSLMPDGASWRYIPNLVDTGFFSPAMQRRPATRLLTVSNLLPHKRVDWVVRAFDAVFADSNVELAIGGDGSERERLQALASKLNCGPRIHFLGALTREGVRREMGASSAFVLASKFETFGIVLIEALAMGCPILATDAGGPTSIVCADNGVLAPADDFTAHCPLRRGRCRAAPGGALP
jgi:glycosyltransferase involved in cell wall biosynthesis